MELWLIVQCCFFNHGAGLRNNKIITGHVFINYPNHLSTHNIMHWKKKKFFFPCGSKNNDVSLFYKMLQLSPLKSSLKTTKITGYIFTALLTSLSFFFWLVAPPTGADCVLCAGCRWCWAAGAAAAAARRFSSSWSCIASSWLNKKFDAIVY